MKKVLGAMSGIIFAVFSIAILGMLMSFTWGALGMLFPSSFVNQMWGMIMFDLAAMCWALAFVFQSNSVGQYAASGIGFIIAFLGTLLMVTADVIMGGQTFVQNANMGQYLVYGFVIVTAIHAALIYLHHASAPEIHQKINIGIASGEITTEAIRQATSELDAQKADLARSISRDISTSVKRDLNIPIAVDPNVGFVPAQAQPQYVEAPRPTAQPHKKQSWFDRMKQTIKPAPMNTNEQVIVNTPQLKKNPLPGPADRELAASIMPGIAPYRSCPKCDDLVPLAQTHCLACGQEMTPISQWSNKPTDPQQNYHPVPMKSPAEETPAPGDAPFPGE
jgi:hypothetical protein